MDAFDIEILVSAIFWVPYTLFMFYLFSEHIVRTKNLQSIILALLAVGCVFRCAWFFCYFSFVHYVVSETINRIAMLFQFSGLSVLMYMWCRAVSIAKLTDTAYNETSKSLIAISRMPVAPKDRKGRVQRYQEANQAVLDKIAAGNTYRVYYLITIALNAVTWCFVLGTLAITTNTWYNINIISISIASLALAVGTLLVGVRVSLALHEVLAPVYLASDGATAYSQEQTLRCACMGKYGARCEYTMGLCGLCSLYAFIFNYNQSDTRQGLQMQREVLKVILSVSTITSFFFVLRSFVFLYRPVVKEYAGDADYSNEIDGTWAYPFFYYQVPELVPNLVIALGISPPNGILRHWARLLEYAYKVAAYYVLYYCAGGEGTSLMYPQREEFLDERPSLSAASLPTTARLSNRTADEPDTREPSAASLAKKATPPLHPQRDGDLERGLAGGGAAAQETMSPVHAGAGASSFGRSNDVRISDGTKNSDASGALSHKSSFQLSHSEIEQAQTAEGGQRGSRHRNPVFEALASSTTRSSAGVNRSTGSLSTTPRSTGSKGQNGRTAPSVSVSLRKNAARGTWEAHVVGGEAAAGEEDEAEEDAWVRERKDSADMAEMVYRINSFSTTSDHISSELGSLVASSLTSSSAGGLSVDGNTAANARTWTRPSIIGGNRTTVPPTKTSQASNGKSSGWGWFS